MKQEKEMLQKMTDLLIAINKVAAPIPAIPAIAPIAPIPAIPQITISGDHDLLQKLDVKVDSLKEDIKGLSDGTTKQISDHETRIKTLENNTTKLMAYGVSAMLIIGFIQSLVLKFWK